eukprot:m.70599 g.70599  ORF g.70599 m.70599 type:complete len:60 (+) comp13780_c0_seq1:1733-1912(+)
MMNLVASCHDIQGQSVLDCFLLSLVMAAFKSPHKQPNKQTHKQKKKKNKVYCVLLILWR